MHSLELVYNKHYFNLAKKFVLRQFKMEPIQIECSRLEQRSVIKLILAENLQTM